VTDVADTTTRRSLTVVRVRGIVARVVWTVLLVLALVLAAAAFSYALATNDGNGLVKALRDLADVFDLVVFDWDDKGDEPVKRFTGENARDKTALFNYGLAAVVYLVVGRFLERVIRP
jgi:hypothetical protein